MDRFFVGFIYLCWIDLDYFDIRYLRSIPLVIKLLYISFVIAIEIKDYIIRD